MTITRAARRLGTCLRPLLQTSKTSFRRYSTGPIPKSPLSQKFQHLIKPFAQSFEKAVPSKIPRFLAAGIACTSSYWLYNALENQPLKKESSTATEIPEVPDENDLSKDFEAKLDARRFTMVDANGKEYDFGSFFHGYGKGLVKGMNLNFRKVTLDNGTKGIELSFRINNIFQRIQLEQMLIDFTQLSPEEQQAFALRCQARGIKIYRKLPYTVDKTAIVKKSAHLVILDGLGSLMVGKDSCYNLKDQVKVTLPEGATFESFKQFLSLFGLQDALKKSNDEDLERLKAGTLYRTFFPKQAHKLEMCDAFFRLPINQLKQRMIEITPAMEEIFAHHTVEKKELFPGYIRYGVRVDKTVYALGGRALTTALTSTSSSELNLEMNMGPYQISTSKELKDKKIDMIINVLKNGLLSREMRDKNGIKSKGLDSNSAYKIGGAQSVYLQMLISKDLDYRRKIGSIAYSQDASVRLYISLKALNQSSYQYENDNFGKKNNEAYTNRTNLFDFVEKIQKDPISFSRHEIMIPDIVLPQHIIAMSVKTESVKQQIISRMRDSNLLQKDQDGIERYNGIPVDEFIHTEDHITPELLKRCHQ